MLDDLLAGLLGEAVSSRLSRSERTQAVVRLVLGGCGAALGVLGAVVFLTQDGLGGTASMRVAMVATFLGLAAVSAVNLALQRRQRWPLALFAGGLVSLFASRLVFGA